MAFDGLITKSIITELRNSIVNGKINKVFEPNNNEIILGIYSSGKNYALDICIASGNYRINLTTHSKPNPLNAPNFCMLLRKYLIGMKIKEIENPDLERLVIITFEGYNELNDLTTRKLIIELMGKHSNIILVNENNVIIDSLRHLDSSSNSIRTILPAHPYILPSSNKISFTDVSSFDEFYNSINNENISINNISKIISDTYTGISKNSIEFIINKLNLDVISKESLKEIYNYLKKIINNINSDNVSAVLFNYESSKKDYSIDLINKENNLSINFFIDDFYYIKEEEDTLINYKNTLLRLILNNLNKYKKKLVQINEKIIECKNMDKYKLYGELITANLYKIPNSNLEFIELENYYDNNNLIKIPLDKSKTPHVNASIYFKKYNKLKNALEFATEQKKLTLLELNYIESIIYELENSKKIEELDEIYQEISETILVKDRSYNAKKVNIKKKQNKKKIKDTTWVPIEYSIDGYQVLIGKNNKQNDYLTTKLAKSYDIWFHTQDIHGSHVILRTNNESIPIEIIEKCASLAAYYSKAKSSSNVPVDYTFVKNVKKPNNSKPGMVIYTGQKTLYVNPHK